MEAYSWECQKLRTTLSEPSRQQLCISLMESLQPMVSLKLGIR